MPHPFYKTAGRSGLSDGYLTKPLTRRQNPATPPAPHLDFG